MDKENTKVTNQIPQAGITVNKGSKVYVNYQNDFLFYILLKREEDSKSAIFFSF